MNLTNIEWTDYTWNPVTGCLGGCPYCYAKRMARRFGAPPYFMPGYHEKRIHEPSEKKKGVKIFVCSMGDLFGPWVPAHWIVEVLEEIHRCPQHTFQFLTKYPERYQEFDFPPNCWLGATITGEESDQVQLGRAGWLSNHPNKKNIKFISQEPILGDLAASPHWSPNVDLLIVGAMTGPSAVIPKPEWFYRVLDWLEAGKKVFFKKNVQKYVPEKIANIMTLMELNDLMDGIISSSPLEVGDNGKIIKIEKTPQDPEEDGEGIPVSSPDE